MPKRISDIPRSELTDKRLYVNRRAFIRAAGGAAAAATAGVFSERTLLAVGRPAAHGPKLPDVKKSAFSTTEDATPWDDITSYNNFFEFAGSDAKDLPSILAPEHLVTKPWSITVAGECARKGQLTLEDVLEGHALEERIYRHRCVEGWSMVIPWVGFPLANFLKKCEPTSKAAFVRFVSHYDPRQMPLSLRLPFGWPYREGLRMDEAMHPLAILAVGLYGEALPHQDGAPIRLVVPWKYGFKSIKSIVQIEFLEQQPLGTYEFVQPRAYGFYSNVNPDVPHPQWDQSTERRIGEFFKRRTLMFNGYGEQVARLYAGMDLRRSY
jgi:sulfoxide reductase catalytic subunit YedY